MIIRGCAGLTASEAAVKGIPMLGALRRQMEGSLVMMAGSLPITQSGELLEILSRISTD